MVVNGKGTELSQKSSVLQIKQDDKFFCRLLSKETSMSHPSFRVAAVAVPFVWESQPGTPKYTIFSEENLPPLTPPPSYYNPKNKNKPMNKKLGSKSNNNPFLTLFLKFRLKKSNNVLSGLYTNSSSASSTSASPAPNSSFSSSWSSLDSSSKVVVPPIGKIGRRRFMSIGSSFDFRGYEEEDGGGVSSSPNSTLCFGIHRSSSSKGNNEGSCKR